MTSSWIFRALSWSLLAELRTTWCSPVSGFVAQAVRTRTAAQATACLRTIARLPRRLQPSGSEGGQAVPSGRLAEPRGLIAWDRALRQEVPAPLAAGTVSR